MAKEKLHVLTGCEALPVAVPESGGIDYLCEGLFRVLKDHDALSIDVSSYETTSISQLYNILHLVEALYSVLSNKSDWSMRKTQTLTPIVKSQDYIEFDSTAVWEEYVSILNSELFGYLGILLNQYPRHSLSRLVDSFEEELDTLRQNEEFDEMKLDILSRCLEINNSALQII